MSFRKFGQGEVIGEDKPKDETYDKIHQQREAAKLGLTEKQAEDLEEQYFDQPDE